MATFRLTLEYDGTDFEGWQAQGDAHRTVQGTLEQAIAGVTGQRVSVVGAGRTDAGVHAEAQVASARVETRLEPARLQRALNATLPPDLVVREAEVVPDGFHARRDARGKLYRYQIWNGRERSPLRERRWAWVPQPLDLDAVCAAAGCLEGTHDFSSFRAAGSSPVTGVRTLHRITVAGEPGGEVILSVAGSGFLRHMVRNLAGTLIEVGRGRRAAHTLGEVLAARDRRRAGPTAPARGLTLVRVDY